MAVISRRRIAAAIDDAHRSFESCVDTLVSVKQRQLDARTIGRLHTFQYDLARALFELDVVFLEVGRHKTAVIKRKRNVSLVWFKAAMRRLNSFKQALEDAMRIGKAIGDSLAWLFYVRDTHLLETHLKHQGQLHTPPGIGGQGELAMIRNPRAVPDHFVLYHGTTTFLRLGDVTLIHLPTFTISGVAELKTRRVDDKTAETTIVLVGDRRILARRMVKLGKSVPPRALQVPMDAKNEGRLRRQLRRMNDLVDLSEPSRRLQIPNESRIQELNALVATARGDALSHQKLADGLVVVAVRLSRRQGKLSSRLLPEKPKNLDKVSEPAPRIAMELVDRSSNKNSLLIQRMHLGYQPGMTPLLWSPLSGGAWRAILFQDVAVWTWLNPLHLVQKLRASGFEVEVTREGVPRRVAIARPGGRAVVDGIDSFMPLIQQHLFTEEGFVANLERMLTTMEAAKLPANTRAVMKLAQFYGSPPPSRRNRRKKGD